MKARRNKVSQEISRNPQDRAALIKEMQDLKQAIKDGDDSISRMEPELSEKLLYIPNMPDSSVPVGKSAEDNKEIGRYGDIREYGFKPLDHHTIGEGLGILDFASAAKFSRRS
jgi:seryl-tRNA synthetase